jgi:hypothetical protein
MPSANRCPTCRETIHPFAATCPSCRTDLDAHRRRTATRRRGLHVQLPRLANNVTDTVVATLAMLLLALFTPLVGALLALFVVWHASHNGLIARRNIAIVCTGIAVFNIVAPAVLLTRLL